MSKQARILMFVTYVDSEDTHDKKKLLLKWDECGLARRSIYKKIKDEIQCVGKFKLKSMILDEIIGNIDG